jgi:hypothetical protein
MDPSNSTSLIFFFIGNYFFTFLIVGLIAAGISLLNKPKPLRINTVAEAFFSYYLLFTIGINNLVNFVFHVFVGDMAAKFIGWETVRFRQKWDLPVSVWESRDSSRSKPACPFVLLL